MTIKLDPPSDIQINNIPIKEGRYIIQLIAQPKVSQGPYVFDGKPFWRIGPSTRVMPQQQYEALLLERANVAKPWDAEIAAHLTIDDLDANAILSTLNESISRGRTKATLATQDPLAALQTLKLLKNGAITNAAGVLFCDDAEKHFPQCLLRLAYFNSTTKTDILDSRRLYGNAFTLLEEVEAFLMRHMSISSDFVPGKMARLDHPEYALRAVREAVVNAICHRDYRMEGGSIGFMLYRDRLEISSHGTLPRGIHLEELKTTHESFPRNSKITHVMYKQGMIESVGTGTQEMLRESQKIGAPDPEYIERGSTFIVIFHKNLQDRQKASLPPRQQEILNIMSRMGACTTTEILKDIKNPPTDRTLRSDLVQLEALGYVLKQGDGRATTWKMTT